jgi:transcriptional regulator with XRE-family HTH domain
MNDSKLDERLLKQKIATNLIYYRKLNNMTQTELAERINYSDKSVSKWERASGVPDIFVMALLADLYGIR